MTALAQNTHRTTEITCPPWCAGHQGNYQGWEERVDDRGFIRDHGEVGAGEIAGLTIALNQVQDARQGFLPPVVEIFTQTGPVVAALTAAEARALAAELISKASRLEENR